MATMLYQPTASQYASAAAHLDLRTEWRTVRINGERYVTVVSGTSGHVYFVRATGGGCECLYYAKCGGVCSHRLAVLLDALEEELREEQASSFQTIRDLFPGCASGCGQITEGEVFCTACASDRERQQRMAAKRENQEELRRLNALLFGSAED